MRTGISKDKPAGTGWQSVEGSLTQISVGPSGVWGVNSNDDIWFRGGTYGGEANKVGTGWTNIPGKLIHITSGSTEVLGVNRQNEVWRRTGISESNPTGRDNAARGLR